MVATAFAIVLCASAEGRADIVNFDLYGKIYTKWLYWNNQSQGSLNWGNPFWKDEGTLGGFAGDNGVASEFEMGVRGRVSRYVEAGVRIQSRWGTIWQDWWENGDMKYDEHNTSGESLGMNHAEYMKLRGWWMTAHEPFKWMRSWPWPVLAFIPPLGILAYSNNLTVGASDLAQFNSWTIGRSRYIDRDNARGWYLNGAFPGNWVDFDLAMIALPRLYVGPGWSTGIGDPALQDPFYGSDWAWGWRVNLNLPQYVRRISVVGDVTRDIEWDRADPDAGGAYNPNCIDALGNEIPGCEMDHAVDTVNRYVTANLTLEVEGDLDQDWFAFQLLAGWSHASLNDEMTPDLPGEGVHPAVLTNGVVANDGMAPIIYGTTNSYAFKGRFEFLNLADTGLSVQLEYFNIGEDWNSIFGSRREADVLLTDGFIEGGQLPTLNLANEFVDFDEPFYESCVGWHGGTALVSWQQDFIALALEGSFLTYNTNEQLRRTPDNPLTTRSEFEDARGVNQYQAIYPNFLHTDGYTDTDLWDYANQSSNDRGRDPRSVYHFNQKRWTGIAMFKGKYTLNVLGGLDFGLKIKYINDNDRRFEPAGGYAADDYDGHLLTVRPYVALGVNANLRFEVGFQYDRWAEYGRKGSVALSFQHDPQRGEANNPGAYLPASPTIKGYFNDFTTKYKPFIGLTYAFEGFQFKWYLEYLNKTLDYGDPQETDLYWSTWRSKASLEVSW